MGFIISLFAAAITAAGVAALFFISALFSTFFGGLFGWCVDAVFPHVVASLNQLSGLKLTGFEMGAVLGFFGSFFRSASSSK